MMYSKRTCLQLFTGIVCLIALTAQAGDFFETDGAALKGFDPVAYFVDSKAVKGTSEHSADYKGSIFYFSTPANRDAFKSDPAKYAPQYNGFCAFGTAGGYKASADPTAFTIVDGKLYVNYNTEVRTAWSKDNQSLISKANKNWPGVEKQTKVIP